MLTYTGASRKPLQGIIRFGVAGGLLAAMWSCCAPEPEPEAEPGSQAMGQPPGSQQQWREILGEIHQRFADVPQLGIDDYLAWLNSERPPPLLVDVRPQQEYAVSHIPGAVHVPAWAGFLEHFTVVPKHRDIVLYCSVGWRSSAAARELRRAGFDKVINLEGSIFAWANQGRPLVDAGGPTEVVHPFNEKWGRLLQARRRAYEASGRDGGR